MIKENFQIEDKEDKYKEDKYKEDKKDKKKKRRMAGSPLHKKQHKISPSYNSMIRKYRKSREKSKDKSK